MSPANAALTPKARLALVRLVIKERWPTARAAEHFHVTWPTARRWATRYAALSVLGPVRAADLADRSSRPHHSPTRTPRHRVKQVMHLRWKRRLSPRAIAGDLGMPASTVDAVFTRCRLNKLSHVDIRTGEVIRRHEHAAPGDLIHVDVRKLGNIPDGGDWRYVGRQQGDRNRAATPGKARNKHYNPVLGTAFVHTVIDDHSRVAYAEVHDDETAASAVGVL